jgi:O-acetyl-ADP-ribose deacetylase
MIAGRNSWRVLEQPASIHFKSNRGMIEVIKGDITKTEADAIVNAANSSLMGGGGVDGAIHKAGGPAILAECKRIVAKQGSCPAGQAVITGAGRLPARFVIHTVGPVWRGGNNRERELLADCYRNSLELAGKNDCRLVAFPNISTGAYRFPKEEAAEIAVRTVNDYLSKSTFDKVIFVCFDEENEMLVKEQVRML